MSAGLDVAALPLRGLHLIEASAGTGKTFTIGLLYLRLLLEGESGLRGIAVVTFTEAATRELRERLRLRVADALRSLRDARSGDDALEAMLAAHRDGGERQRRAVERLDAALTGFDEAFVSTIHGFCRQLLAETAFESGLPFIELEADANGEALREFVRDFWRLRVVAGDDEAARDAAGQWGGPDALALALASSQALAIDPEAVDPVDPASWLKHATARLAQASVEWQECVANGTAVLALEELAAAAAENRLSVAREGPHHADTIAACARAIASGGVPYARLVSLHRRLIVESAAGARRKGWLPGAETAAISRVVESLLDAADEVRLARRAVFFVDALDFVRAGLAARRERLRRFGFDDLIRVLHERLHGQGGEALARTIAQGLPALLVDEFQDTDPLQYAILRRLHGAREDGAMFLIGDPKQAIYRFRGGDVFTYRSAAGDAGANVHTLVHNWRSDARLVTAVNAIFDRDKDAFLHPFIGFTPAACPADKARKAQIGEAATPLVIWRLPDEVGSNGTVKPWSAQAFTGRVLGETAAAIKRQLVDARTRGIKVSIAVLVNTNRQAAEAAGTLARWNIACDHLGTESVYETDEAEAIARVLAALASPGDAAAARAALATELLGEDLAGLLASRNDLDRWEAQLERLAGLRRRWHDAGPFAAMAAVIQAAAPRLLEHWDGRRRLTNLLHLAELLQKASAQRPSTNELLHWLEERRREATERRGEGSREQVRMADDPGEVQVLTIHRSKGLEFDLVYAPFLARTRWDEPGDLPGAPVTWHDDTSLRIDVGGPEWHSHALSHRDEQFAEGLRLAYVALTRARVAAFTAWAYVNLNVKTSVFSPLAWLFLRDASMTRPEDLAGIDPRSADACLDRLAAHSAGTIGVEMLEAGQPDIDTARLPGKAVALFGPQFDGVIDRRHETLSYSRLFGGNMHAPVADHDESQRGEAVAVVDDRDADDATPIPQWPRGAAFGNCVHKILETVPFAELASAVVHATLARIARDEGYDAGDVRMIASMLRATVTTPLPGMSSPFTLAGLARSEALSELEFLVPLPGARLDALDAILADVPEHARAAGELVRRRREVAGLMTGFIDLVLRHDGLYYVVDYKTNLLGASAADYAPSRLAAAVRAHDYDLQYLIYLVALQRFLRARLGSDYAYDTHVGGALYLFVRGLGTGDGHGIHADRPPRALIDRLDCWCAGGDA